MNNAKYYLFAGHNYYPDGGMNDFIGAYETLDAARARADRGRFDWWHIATLDANGTLIIVVN